MPKKGFTCSRIITEKFFNDVKARALITAGDLIVYDEFLDETIEKVVRNTIYRYLQDKYLVEDAMQMVKENVWLKANEYLRRPECNCKEYFEAWMVRAAKWAAIRVGEKHRKLNLEYIDELTGEDIEFIYDDAEQETINIVLRFILNVDTEPAKNMCFIICKLIVPELGLGDYVNTYNFNGSVQKVAHKYALTKLSPTTDSNNAGLLIVKELVHKEASILSNVVIGLDTILAEANLVKTDPCWYGKLVQKLNSYEGETKVGERSLVKTVELSKQVKGMLKSDSNGNPKIDEETVKVIAEYITKGNNRIKKPLEAAAFNAEKGRKI